MNKYVCFHGHFYQPPREDPWLEVIPFQKDASPYHDWNERICGECYGPNRAARRVDDKGRILEIINNYEFISYNFGPTILSWLKKCKVETYEKIIEADRASEKKFGYGNAIAQVYNHVIMPLANSKDKLTQIIWGIEVFKYHFGRTPSGMWLAETAVDNETLAILAEQGIKFTILSPKQAERVRPFDGNWQNIDEVYPLDVGLPHRCFPRPGLCIDIFFYQESISLGVVFGDLLKKGEFLAKAIESAFRQDASPQIISIVSDGETYGHHHKFGEMALAHNLYYFERHPEIKLTNYSQFLSLYQPGSEVAIKEGTAWSCSHGIGRWYRDCGCHTGLHPDWHQKWRGPLRESLEFLRENIDPLFERLGEQLLNDPWAARNDYINIILDPSHEVKENFLAKHQKRGLSNEERATVFKLLEMQYHGQLMFTSCGWYFDDISGIEARQNLHYAARLIQLAKGFGMDLEEVFLQILKKAESNIAKYGDGASIYENLVYPRLYEIKRLSIHFAFDHIVKEEEFRSKPFYIAFVDVNDYEPHETSGCTLTFSRLSVTHIRSEESEQNLLAILHLGGLDITGSIVLEEALKKQLLRDFYDLAFYEVRNNLQALPYHYGIKDLFLDNRQEIALKLIEEKLSILKNNYRLFYEENKELMLYLHELWAPIEEVFLTIIKVVLQERAYEEIEKALKGEENEWKNIKEEAKRWGIDPGTSAIRWQLKEFIEERLKKLKETLDLSLCKPVGHALNLYLLFFPTYDLWEAQNLFWETLPLVKQSYRELLKETIKLGKILGFKLS